MRRWQKLAIVVGLAAIAAAAIYAEFVLDVRASRSSLRVHFNIESAAMYDLAEVKRRGEEFKARFGPKASTSISGGGVLTTKVNGEVVNRDYMKGVFAGVSGAIVVTKPGEPAAYFLYDLSPDKDPKDNGYYLPDAINRRFQRDGIKALTFTKDDLGIGDCIKPEPNEFGLGPYAGHLGFQKGIACVIYWKRQPASMLINVIDVENNRFVFPFTRWICRAATTAALNRVVPMGEVLPDFAACIFVNRASATRSRAELTITGYEVRPDRGLARMVR